MPHCWPLKTNVFPRRRRGGGKVEDMICKLGVGKASIIHSDTINFKFVIVCRGDRFPVGVSAETEQVNSNIMVKEELIICKRLRYFVLCRPTICMQSIFQLQIILVCLLQQVPRGLRCLAAFVLLSWATKYSWDHWNVLFKSFWQSMTFNNSYGLHPTPTPPNTHTKSKLMVWDRSPPL